MYAIVISGSLRNLAETWPENKKFFDTVGEPYEVYIHTWSANYGTPRKVYKDRNWKGFVLDFRPRIYESQEIEVTQDLLLSIIPDAHIIIEEFDERLIVEKFKIPGRTETSLHQNFVNSVAMYQGISRGFRSALTSHPKGVISNYVRLRTDFVITRSFDFSGFSGDMFFAGPGVDPGFGYVSDQFFICSRPVAEIIAESESELFSRIMDIGWGADSNTPFYGERILSYILREKRVRFLFQTEPIVGEIKRPGIVHDSSAQLLKHIFSLFNFNFRVMKDKTTRGLLLLISRFRR